LDGESFGLQNNVFYLTSKEEKLAFSRKFKEILIDVDGEIRNRFMEMISNKLGKYHFEENLFMNWDDLRTVYNSGVYISSHTKSHPVLSKITDIGNLREELLVSKERIEAELKYTPLTISYPKSAYNEQVIKIAKEVGYKFGLVVNQTTYKPNKHNLFEIPRIELFNENLWKSKLRIYEIIQNLKKLKGSLTS
jgi:peptidoglycan/xylan/chitin deacetylase (PgdA/CDA1 family)